MGRIAIVEDDPRQRTLLSGILRDRGHLVWTFGTLASALDELTARPPDLLLVDVGLPDGSGLELIARLRDTQVSRFPIIVTSGFASESDFKRGFAAGADDYVRKPYHLDELLAKCDVHLDRAKGSGTVPLQRLRLPGGKLAFHRYRIEGTCGLGSYGVVYEATDMRTDQPVALKVLTLLQGSRAESRLRFLREIYALSTARHPNVVQVLDFGVSEGRLYYSMERIEGPTVREQAEAVALAEPSQLRALLRALSKALVALHEVGILHRDLTPSNIILRDGRWDQPVLIDFGLAKRSFDHGVTQDDLIMGTPGYLDPTLVEGLSPAPSGDLFALGMVARFAALGSDPFPAFRGMSLVNHMVRHPAPLPEGLPADLHELLGWLTQIDRRRRPRSAQAVLEALQLQPV